ncbi:hypothetical protein [Vagococcus sp. WN89Y]|uniref:hypothetical protein n=1 Tax=Vagococcus sp. WN89Y TaxID=3457258 RepID=UPI003FCD1140
MPVSTHHYRSHIGHHYNRTQPQNMVPVHTKIQHADRSESPLLKNIHYVAPATTIDVERQSGKSMHYVSRRCPTGKVVFSLLACGAMATAAGIIIRDMIAANGAEDGRLLKTDYFAQGKMEYFANKRVEYTLKAGHDGYLLDNEKLSLKPVHRL